jgi:carbamate kinase
VPSPLPQRIFQIKAIKTLLDSGAVVVCTGGGGIPTMYLPGEHELEGPWDFNPRHLVGVEAVIDKDRSSAVLAEDLEADLLVIATDADAVYLDWGTPDQKAIATASPDDIEAYKFPAGSMGPKVEAAAEFARKNPGGVAVIGALEDLQEIMDGTKGTRITTDASEVTFR